MSLTNYHKNKDYYIWKVSEKRREIKRKAIAYKGGKCERCGYNKCENAMHFHHLDPTQKDFGIGSGHTKRWEKIKPELDKCTLICANCHAEAHYKEKEDKLKEQEQKARLIFNEKKNREYILVSCPTCKKEFKTSKTELSKTQRHCSSKCWALSVEKINWPSDEKLRELIFTKPLAGLAKELGVTDNAIRRRCKRHKIDLPPKGYWAKKDWRQKDKLSFKKPKVERPSKELLNELLWKIPTIKIAKQYNVSDKAVEKWARKYGLEKPKRGYWAKHK